MKPISCLIAMLLFVPAAHAQHGPQTLTTTKPSWPMFRGNQQRTGVSNDRLPEAPAVVWKFSTGEDAVTSSAVIGDGVAYVGSDGGIFYALSLSDGALRWKIETTTSAPATTQSIRPAIQSSACLHQDKIFFGDEEGVFHALDKSNGRPLWKFQANAEIISSALAVEDRVLFGCYDGNLYCLSTKDGKLVWQFETEGKVHASPTLVEDGVLIAGCDGKLRVVKVADGKEVRSVEIGGYSGSTPPVVGTETIVGTFSNTVVGMDWKTAKVKWTYENPDRQFPYLSSAAATGKLMIIGGRDKTLHAFDAKTGKRRWGFEAKGRIDSSPAVVGDRVFVGSMDGNLYAVDLETGKERWRFEAGDPISASPAVGEGRLVVGTEGGAIFCFGEKKK